MSTSTLRWQRLLAVVVILVMIAASFGFNAMVASAKPAPAYKTLTGKAQGPVGFAVSQPLSMLAEKMQKPQIDSSLTPLVGNNAIQEFLGGRQIPRQVIASNPFNLPGRQGNRPIIGPDKRLFDDVPSPGVDWQWAGLAQNENRVWYSYGVYPPDTQGDVSATHYIQVVNIQMAIWDLTTSQQWTSAPKTLWTGPINTLWAGSGMACENSEDGDPVVVYDEYAGRWLVSQFEVSTGNYECIAVSATSDPMGSWYLYQYSFPVMNDYPKFGVWHDGYYMSINQFNPSWAGQGVVVFDKVAMQAGNPAAAMIYIDAGAACTTGAEPECVLGGMIPSDADGTTAPTGNQVFMEFDDDAWGYSGDQLQLWELVPNWLAGTATFTHLVDLPTAAFDSEVCAGYSRNCIPQLGTTQGLDAISDRLMYRLQFRDFGSYKAMVVNHTVDVSGAGQAGIRWYELRNTGSGWGIYQQGDFAPDSKNRWMGSAAMDDVGNIALGYSVSDATIYPGIRYTVHLASDPLGTMRTETTLVNGGGAQTGTGARWGDYSMMSVYPQGAGGCDFYYTQEYLRGTTSAEWSTWLGVFHNASCYNADTVSPDTTIDTNPTDPSYSSSASFTFSGTDNVAVASFECSLDGATFAACTSPKNYTGLTLGAHTFDVRAIDTSSNVDSTPANYGWTVADNTPPDTTIDTTPTDPSTGPVTFAFSGTDDFAVASYECSLDGAAYAACTTPKTYTGLLNGAHTFDVRAIDTSANVDLSPAHFGWTVANPTVTSNFVSQAANDGYVIETTETSGLGGAANATAATFSVGDYAADRQVKGFLSFNTAALPNGAVITGATLRMRYAGVVGTNPYGTHGALKVDIAKPFFGAAAGLLSNDFQFAASANNVAACGAAPVASWYSCNLTSFGFINKTGTTQFRLGFTLTDNDDLGADLVQYFSGNSLTAAYRPVLVISYYVP